MRHLHDKLCRKISSPKVFPLTLSEWGDKNVAKNARAITVQTLKPDGSKDRNENKGKTIVIHS
jgi:hypothetical protein